MTKAPRPLISVACLLALAASGCSLSLSKLPGLPARATPLAGSTLPTATVLPRAQSVFIAKLPEPLGAGETLALALLDEVTGLALKAQLYPMQQSDPTTYSATLALPYRAIVKYRYVRLGTAQFPEDTALDHGIRYRLFFAVGPAEVRDVISSWSDRPSSAATGSIQGRILNADTGAPIPDILVTAAGQRCFTDSAGRFSLQGLGTGTHNLVAYAIDGTYETFQQGATVAAGLNTAVDVHLQAAPLVKITFVASAPSDIQGVPVRIAGNLIELGNAFADLQGGVSAVPERMPVMSLLPDGRYSATVSLPAGAYVEYKYTLGDGFWNAERTTTGAFQLRELVVPHQDAVIQDAVDTWAAGNGSPILFEAAVPANTPAQDIVSIQFNAWDWTEPIPMWPLGGNRWAYKLYGPINNLGTLHYRYCRAGQCGSADDAMTAGPHSQGRLVGASPGPQNIKDTVAAWNWLGETEPGTLVGTAIDARPAGFVAGVEFLSAYQPNWTYYNPQAIQGVQALGANWLVFTPTWTYVSADPLVFGLEAENSPFWLDNTIMISQAKAANLNVAVFPMARLGPPAQQFWGSAARNEAWWQSWIEQYRAFAVEHADLAAQTGVQALVLGGDWLEPALPDGQLPGGADSGVPADADLRWQAILTEVRQHFSGKIWWALPFAEGVSAHVPDFLRETDGVYLLWAAPLAANESAPKAELEAEAGRLLDSEVAPLQAAVDEPILLALAYPSTQGIRSGCPGQPGTCLPWQAFDPAGGLDSGGVDLSAQVDLYEAVLNAVNSRQYIAGVISRGFFPPTLLQDHSASIHGKPAADLLWYWFPRLTGAIR
ncbi:MAG TPA: carboxypeptidase regulatory-like domain-containing protein [Anaerolineales bacterium]|nr:carboxypeptidase regulatory-like domain-containing protein [Anaerolineales bacterium]